MGAFSTWGDAVTQSHAQCPVVWHLLLDKRNGDILKALSACRAIPGRTIAGTYLSQTLFSSGLPAVETVLSSCNLIAILHIDGAQGLCSGMFFNNSGAPCLQLMHKKSTRRGTERMQFTKAQEYIIRHIILNTQAKLWPVYHQWGMHRTSSQKPYRARQKNGRETAAEHAPHWPLSNLRKIMYSDWIVVLRIEKSLITAPCACDVAPEAFTG